MQIKTKTIRNLKIIEKELNTLPSGVVMLPLEVESEQFATTFVYHNKNIYFFINDNELYRKIVFGSISKFTAIKNSSISIKSKQSTDYNYTLFYISISGIVKNIKEKNTIDSVYQGFIQKYSGKLIDSDSKSKSFSKLVYIDTEEMTATEEIGLQK